MASFRGDSKVLAQVISGHVPTPYLLEYSCALRLAVDSGRILAVSSLCQAVSGLRPSLILSQKTLGEALHLVAEMKNESGWARRMATHEILDFRHHHVQKDARAGCRHQHHSLQGSDLRVDHEVGVALVGFGMLRGDQQQEEGQEEGQ